ncbi:hypothetical protein EGW08_000782 [Elysia chlorotica]|uniref:Uncharacterized protein n=1 Tax=Elysia chlorotica TaxID=188477 RepID=A0A433UCD7_ELYCH|nr:hypothetical protein EGW08_000782 [Elysia chlorotica]
MKSTQSVAGKIARARTTDLLRRKPMFYPKLYLVDILMILKRSYLSNHSLIFRSSRLRLEQLFVTLDALLFPMDGSSKDGEEQAIASSEAAGGSPDSVRKSSRSRKKSKRILDSVDSDVGENPEVSAKKQKKSCKRIKSKKRCKDVLENGRPFVCSLCESKCINPSKVRRKNEPIFKERDGQILQLCVDCGIAVGHTESRGPSQEQKQEFEEEGRQFAQHLASYLGDNEAIRLYCSFYAISKCGCIQNFISGNGQSKRKKYSCSDPEIPSLLPEECIDPPDEKADKGQKARYLLQLLKESKRRKNFLRSNRSRTSSNQSVSSVRSMDSQSGCDTDTGSNSGAAAAVRQRGEKQDPNLVSQKKFENFILVHRSKLKKIGICERGCQRVLCYSNNFLHKKSVFRNEARLQRTKGKAALGQLDAVEELPNISCCEKACVKFAKLKPGKVAQWRSQAQQSQRESWRVIADILASTQITDGSQHACFRFITLVTGCCLATVRKVYAETLLFKGRVSEREHGLRCHWRRQKQGRQSLSESSTGQPENPEQDNAQPSSLKSESPGVSGMVVTNAAHMQDLASDKVTKFTNFSSQSTIATQPSASLTPNTGKLKDLLNQEVSLSRESTAVSSTQLSLPKPKSQTSMTHTVVNSNLPVSQISQPRVFRQPTLTYTVTTHESEANLPHQPNPSKPSHSVQVTAAMSSLVVSSPGNLSRSASQALVGGPLRTFFSEKSANEQHAVSSTLSQLAQPNQPRLNVSNVGLLNISAPGVVMSTAPQHSILTKSSLPLVHQVLVSDPVEKFTGIERQSQTTPADIHRGVGLQHSFASGSQLVSSIASALPAASRLSQILEAQELSSVDGRTGPTLSSTMTSLSQAIEKSPSHTLLQAALSKSPLKTVSSLTPNPNPTSCLPGVQNSPQQLKSMEKKDFGQEVNQQSQGLAEDQNLRHVPGKIPTQHAHQQNQQNMQSQLNLSSAQLESGLFSAPPVAQQQPQQQQQHHQQQQQQQQQKQQSHQPQQQQHHQQQQQQQQKQQSHQPQQQQHHQQQQQQQQKQQPHQQQQQPHNAETDQQHKHQENSMDQQQQARVLGDFTLITVVENGVSKLYLVPKNSSSPSSSSTPSLLQPSNFLPMPSGAIPVDGSLLSQGHPAPSIPKALPHSSVFQSSVFIRFNFVISSIKSESYDIHVKSFPSIKDGFESGFRSLHTTCLVKYPKDKSDKYFPNCDQPRVSSTIQPSSYDNSNSTSTSLSQERVVPQLQTNNLSSTSLQKTEILVNATQASQGGFTEYQTDILHEPQAETSNASQKPLQNTQTSAIVVPPPSIDSKNPQLGNENVKAVSAKDRDMAGKSNANNDNHMSLVETQALDSPSSVYRPPAQQPASASSSVLLSMDSTLSMYLSDPPVFRQRSETEESQSSSPLFVSRSDSLTGGQYTDGTGVPTDLLFHPVNYSPSSYVFDALSDSPVNHQYMSFLNDFALSSSRRLSFSGQPVSGAHVQTTLTSPVQHEFFSKFLASNRSGSSSSSRQSPVLCFSSSFPTANPSLPAQSLISLLQGGEDSLSKQLSTSTSTASPVCGGEGTNAAQSELVTHPLPSAGAAVTHPPASTNCGTAHLLRGLTSGPEAHQSELLSSVSRPEGQGQTLSTCGSEPVSGSSVTDQTSHSDPGLSVYQAKQDSAEPRSRLLLEKLLRSGTPVDMNNIISSQPSGVVKPAVVSGISPSSTSASLPKTTEASVPSSDSNAYKHFSGPSTSANISHKLDSGSETLSGQSSIVEKIPSKSGSCVENQQSSTIEKVNSRSYSQPVSQECSLSTHTSGNMASEGNRPPALFNSNVTVTSAGGQSQHALSNSIQNQSLLQRIEVQDLPSSQQGFASLFLQQMHGNSSGSGSDQQASGIQEFFSQVFLNNPELVSSNSSQGSASIRQSLSVQNFQGNLPVSSTPLDRLSNTSTLAETGNISAVPHTVQIVSADGQNQRFILIPHTSAQDKQQQQLFQQTQQPEQLLQESQQQQHQRQLQQANQQSKQAQPTQQLAQLSFNSQKQQQQAYQLNLQPQQLLQQVQQLSQQPQQIQQISQQPQQIQQLSQQPQQIQLSEHLQQVTQLSQQSSQIQQVSQQPQQIQLSQQQQQVQQRSQQQQQIQQLSQQPQQVQVSQQPQQFQQISQQQVKQLTQQPQQLQQLSQQPQLQQLSQQPQQLQLSQQPQQPQLSQQPQKPTLHSQQLLQEAQPLSQEPQQLLYQLQLNSQQQQSQLSQYQEQPAHQISQQPLQPSKELQQLPQQQQQVKHVHQISQQQQKVAQETQYVSQGTLQHLTLNPQLSQPVLQILQQQPQLLLQFPQQLSQQVPQQILQLDMQASQSTARLGKTSSTEDHTQFGAQQIQVPIPATAITGTRPTSTAAVSADNKGSQAKVSNSSVLLPTSEGQKWMTVPISEIPRGTSGPSKPPKQRRIMPKLAPVPQQAKGRPKSNFILVPDKPGYPALPLSSVNPQSLSWLTPGQTIQIRTVAPHTESKGQGGSGGQQIILTAGGQQLLVQPVPGQLANLSQAVGTSVQSGVKLVNVPLASLSQPQPPVAKLSAGPSSSQVASSLTSSVDGQNLSSGQTSLGAAHQEVAKATHQLPQDKGMEHQRLVTKLSSPGKTSDQQESRTVIPAARSVEFLSTATSINQPVVATSAASIQTVVVSTHTQNICATNASLSNISQSNLNLQQVTPGASVSKPLDLQASGGVVTPQSSCDQLSTLQQLQQNATSSSTVTVTTGEKTAEALLSESTQLPLLLQQLIGGPGPKLILTNDDIVATSVALSSPSLSNQTFVSTQMYQAPSVSGTITTGKLSMVAQNKTQISDANTNPANKRESHIIFPSEPSGNIFATQAGSCVVQTDHSKQKSSKESDIHVSVSHILDACSTADARQGAVDKTSKMMGVNATGNTDTATQISTSDGNNSLHKEHPRPELNLGRTLTLSGHEVIDLTDDNMLSPQSRAVKRQGLGVHPPTEKHLPQSNLLLKELSKTVSATSIVTDSATRISKEQSEDQRNARESQKESPEALRFVSYQHIQTPAQRLQQQPQMSPIASLSSVQELAPSTLSSSGYRFLLPSSWPSSVAISGERNPTTISSEAPQGLTELPQTSLTGNMVLLLPKDAQIGQLKVSTHSNNVWVSQGITLSSQSVPTSSGNGTLSGVGFSQGNHYENNTNASNPPLTIIQSSVALPTPIKSQLVEAPHRFTSSNNQPPIITSEASSAPRISASLESATLSKIMQGIAPPPSYEKSSSVPLTLQMSSSPKILSVSTRGPHSVSEQSNTSSTIRRPNSIPISVALPRHVNMSTSQAPTFRRTSNTPTDAVGPPNITIVSPSGSSPAHLLKFNPVGSSTGTPVISLQQPARSSRESFRIEQPSSVSSISHVSIDPAYTPNSEPMSHKPPSSEPGLQSLVSSSGYSFSTGLISPSPKEVQATTAMKQSKETVKPDASMIPVSVTDNSAEAFKERLLQSHLNPSLKKPNKPRKRSSTINDLLKMKSLQAQVEASRAETVQPNVPKINPQPTILQTSPKPAIIQGNTVQEVLNSTTPITVMLARPGQSSNLVLVANSGTTLQTDSAPAINETSGRRSGGLGADASGTRVLQSMTDVVISNSTGTSGQKPGGDAVTEKRMELSQGRELYQTSSALGVPRSNFPATSTGTSQAAGNSHHVMPEVWSAHTIQDTEVERIGPETIQPGSSICSQPERNAEFRTHREKDHQAHLKMSSQPAAKENPPLPSERAAAGKIHSSQINSSPLSFNLEALTSKGMISSHNPLLAQFLFNTASESSLQPNSQTSNHLQKVLLDPASQNQALWNERVSHSVSVEDSEVISKRGYTNRAPPAYEEATRGSKGFVGHYYPVAPALHESSAFSPEQRAQREPRDMQPIHCHERITKVIDDIYTPDEPKPSSSYDLERQKSYTASNSKHRSGDAQVPGSLEFVGTQVARESVKDDILPRKVSPRDLDQNGHGWKIPGSQRKAPSKGKGSAHLKRVQFCEDVSMQQTSNPQDSDATSISHSDSRALWEEARSHQSMSHDQVVIKHPVTKQSKRMEQEQQQSLNVAPKFASYRHLSHNTLKPTPTTKPLSAVRHSQASSERYHIPQPENKWRTEVQERPDYTVQHDSVDFEDRSLPKQSTLRPAQALETGGSLSSLEAQDLYQWRELQERANPGPAGSSDNRPSSFKIISPQGYSRLNRQRLLSTTSSESSCSPQVESRPFPQHPHQSQQHQQPSSGLHLSSEALETNSTSTFLSMKVSKNVVEGRMYEADMSVDTASFVPDSHKFTPNAAAAQRQLSQSPAIRHDVIQADYELSQQMMQYKSMPNFEPEQPTYSLMQLRDEAKSLMRPSRFDDRRETAHIYSPSKFSRLVPSAEDEMLSLRVSSHSPSNSSVNSLGSDVAVNLISASTVDGTLERVCSLIEGNDKLSNQNEMLRRKVTRAEQQAERFQHQHQHHNRQVLSPVQTPGAASVDSEESGIGTEGGEVPLSVDSGSGSSQWRRSKHPSSSSGILKSGSTPLDHETGRPLLSEDHLAAQASTSSGTRRRHLSSGLRMPIEYVEALHRVGVPLTSPLPFSTTKLISPCSDYVISECLRAGDPLVSSSILRPPSQLDNEISAYNHGFASDPTSHRHRYPSASDLKQLPHFQYFEQDCAVEGVRPRNLSSSLGIRFHPDPEMLLSSTALDSLQRQRNLSASSIKDGASNAGGSRSRNPSSSSLRQYFISDISQPYNVIRSRNPSGSSNRRSRPGSSSSDREFPFVNAGDDLISIPDFCHSRSRNSSGDSNLEPTVKHVALDVIQIYQNLKFNH